MGDPRQPKDNQSPAARSGSGDYSVVLRLPLGWRVFYGVTLVLAAAVVVAVLLIARETVRLAGDVRQGVGPGAGVVCPAVGMLVLVVIGAGLPCRPIRISVGSGALHIRGVLGPGPKTIPLSAVRWVREVNSYALEWPAPCLDKSQWVVGAREWAYSARAQLPLALSLFGYTYRQGVVLGLGDQGTLFIEAPDSRALVETLQSRGVRVVAAQTTE